jgi:hypothetical protein
MLMMAVIWTWFTLLGGEALVWCWRARDFGFR